MLSATATEIHHGRIAAVRIGPNEDLVEGLCEAVASIAFERAVILSGLGSLIDAVIEIGLDEPQSVVGPAIEILSLAGQIFLGQKDRELSVIAILGTTAGAVVAGRLMPGRNPVCVTAEVVLQEIREG